MGLKIYKESISSHIDDETDVHDASAVSFVPTGGISSDNVQDAIVEVAQSAVAGTVPDGSLTIQKLAFDPVTQEELVIYGHEVWPQIQSSAVWTIIHSLPYMPSVTIVDSVGNVVWGTVRYVNSTTIEVTFSAPFSGKAYLS